ncbi:DUF4367 domain-containing protein [Paenibacillus sp. GCM10028914]|uniref:DUF4367 domain-containing protein n=1 Tax=Paenibacillus sp. GCM10028914 TaxID=3273416 RepID=UPI003621C8FA
MEEKLRSYERQTSAQINVRTNVMERISRLPKKQTRLKLWKRPLVTAASIILVASLTVTAYGASKYFQIRNTEGNVVLETKLKETFPEDHKVEKLYSLISPYSSIAQRSALPGQDIVYYIHDENINKLQKETRGANQLLEFSTTPLSLGNLNTLQSEVSKRGVPSTILPSRLLTEYTFDEGNIVNLGMPVGVFDEHGPTEAYYEIQEELIRQAEASTNNKKVFVKALESPSTSSIWLIYTKGKGFEDHINVQILMRAGIEEKQQISHTDEDIVEKVMVKGQEMIYVQYTNQKDKVDYDVNQILRWVDEKNNLEYNITSSIKSNLSKEKLIKVAEEFVQ